MILNGGDNTEIRISKQNSGMAVNIIGVVKKNAPLTFKLTKDMLPLAAAFYASQGVSPSSDINCKFSNFIIKESDTNDTYAEHKEQNITFPLKQKFYKNSYLTDDGIHHKRKQIVLDGTEAISLDTNSLKNVNRVGIRDICKKGDIGKLCSHFKYVKNFHLDEEHFYIDDEGYTYLFINKTVASTVAELKAYLAQQKEAGTSVIIEVELVEEEIESYNEEQQVVYEQIKKTAKSYGEKTYIFCTDEISCNFDVEARKDLNILFTEVTT